MTEPLWRHGNRQPRNLYRGDAVVGLVDSVEIAEQIIAAMNGDPDRDERLRAEGRRQADNAITWNTTCVGCAERLDGLIAERHAGALEAAEEIEAEIRTYVNRTGNRGALEAVVLVREYIARGLQRSPETPQGFAAGRMRMRGLEHAGTR